MKGEKLKIEDPTSYWKLSAEAEAFHKRVDQRRKGLLAAAGLGLIAHILHTVDNDIVQIASYGLGGIALLVAGGTVVSKLREKKNIKPEESAWDEERP